MCLNDMTPANSNRSKLTEDSVTATCYRLLRESNDLVISYLFHRINKFVSYFVYDKRYITELKIKCLAELFMLLNSKRKYKSVFRIKYKLNL